MKQGLPNNKYKVRIQCSTYNHAKYIEDALRGFSMQQTDFPFVCCVMDDASTDGEQEILKRWVDDHCNAEDVEVYDHPLTIVLMAPDKGNRNCIYVIHLLKYNTWGKPERRELLEHWRRLCEYEALCEGDDYWTDPLKLQKQVDFLESHPGYVMCWHQCRFYYQEEDKFTIDYPMNGIDSITSLDFLNGLSMPQTLTLLYKREALDLKAHEKSKFVGDIVLYYMLLMHGKGHCMGEVMGVYRIHGSGVWSGANPETKFLWELKARMSIYEIDPQRETAIYLLRLIEKSNSRLSLIKLTSKLLPIYRIIYKHLGLSLLLRFLVNRYVLNKKTIL